MFPSAVLAALLLSLFLHWPSLASGFRTDDYVQAAMLRRDFPVQRSRLDLFDFAAGTPQDFQRLVEFGHLPWWTNPRLRLRMWRPIASALIALDHDVFGDDAIGPHVHTLAWLVLLLMAAARLLSRALSPATASLAILFYAINPCHVVPVAWLANRSTLLACAFGFLAVELQIRHRDAPSIRRFALTAIAASLALLSAEYALCALSYALAYAALGAEGSTIKARLRSARPVLIPLGAYLVLHTAVGSDIIGSGFYLSPIRDPLAYTRALFVRAPVLVADQLFSLPSLYFTGGHPLRGELLSWNLFSPNVWLALPDWQSWHVVIGYAAIGLAILLARAAFRSTDRAPLRWLAIGTALSLLPSAGSLPEDRLLVASTLGGSALLASTLRSLLGPDRRRRIGPLVIAFAIIAVQGNQLRRSYVDARGMRLGAESMRVWALDADLPDANSATTDVYLLAAGDFNTAVNLPWLRRLHGRPLPRSYRRLCPGPLPVDITRSSDRVLDIEVLTNALFGTALPSLYRALDAPMHAGDHFVLPGLTIDVTRVYQDNPSHIRFSFDRSIDDASLWFLIATPDGLRHRAMPALHQTLRVPYAQFRDLRQKG